MLGLYTIIFLRVVELPYRTKCTGRRLSQHIIFLANLLWVRKEKKGQRQRKKTMLLLRSVVAVLVVIPVITQYINVQRKNNNTVERLSSIFFYVPVWSSSSLLVLPGKKKKVTYLTSTNDKPGSYYLFAFICEKDSRISSVSMSLLFRGQNR